MSDTAYFNALENQYGLPLGILNGVMQVESSGNTNAVSSKGAQGPFQLMPATQADLGVENPYDTREAAAGAALYLSQLQEQTGSIQGALQAYNWGIGNYQKNNGNVPSSVSQYSDNVLSYLNTYDNPALTVYISQQDNASMTTGKSTGKTAGNSPGTITSDKTGDGQDSIKGTGDSSWINDILNWITQGLGNFVVILAGLIILGLAIWFSLQSNAITIKMK